MSQDTTTDTRSYGRELDLVLLLSDGKFYTTGEMAIHLGVTRRHLYNYFEALKSKGFRFDRRGYAYALDMNAPFFDNMRRNATLSAEEASYICRVLHDLSDASTMALAISGKLRRLYSLPDPADAGAYKRITGIANKLRDAIAQKSTVRLNRYSSPHSNTESDRIVEPFLMINDRQDVICYEINSATCKTFKLARIASVDTLGVRWTYEERHKAPYTDIFGFTGNAHHSVSLRLGLLSHNLLIEEYPAAAPLIVPDGHDHWRVDMLCVSLLGITRFVLGLYDDIEVIGDSSFKRHIKEKVAAMK